MARAKRTDRAEARRRNRAQQLAEQEASTADEESPKAAAATRTAPSQEPARTGVGGITYAFRAAIHPANVREDVAYLPRLVRHPAVWAPILVSVGTAVASVITGGRDGVTVLLLPFFVWPPPQIGAIFIAGFFAPRASYLAGLIVATVASLAVAVVVAAAPGPISEPGIATPGASPEASASAGPVVTGATSPAPSTSPSAGPLTSPAPSSAASGSVSPQPSGAPTTQPSGVPTTQPSERLTPGAALALGLGISPAAGVLLGSFSAWYRRFLRLANPNRGRPPARRQPNKRR